MQKRFSQVLSYPTLRHFLRKQNIAIFLNRAKHVALNIITLNLIWIFNIFFMTLRDFIRYVNRKEIHFLILARFVIYREINEKYEMLNKRKEATSVEYSWHIFSVKYHISLITLHDTIIKKYTVLCEITIGTISKI